MLSKMKLASITLLIITAAVLLNPFAAAAPITLTPSKTKYSPGDALVVSGTATPNYAVSTQVYNPSSALVGVNQGDADVAGNYNITVFNWPAQPTSSIPLGVYRIRATDAANSEFIEVTVEFAQAVESTKTVTVISTTTLTSTVTTTSTTTSRTTETSTTTLTTTSTTTSTTTQLTTSTVTSVSTTTSSTTSTVTATTTSATTSTVTSTTTSATTSTVTSTTTVPPSTTMLTSVSTETVGLPSEVTYAAVAVAAVAIVAAAILAMRRRAA